MENISFQDIDKSVEILKNNMIKYHYNIATPLPQEIQEFIQSDVPPADWNEIKKNIHKDIKTLFDEVEEVKYFYTKIDGLEFNAATIYGFSQIADGEMLWSNIYTMNFYNRDNEIFIDPDLKDNIVIGEDSMSYFLYNMECKTFEIRDKIAPGVLKSFIEFNGILKYIIRTTEL
ncbi:YrhA family protein [Enterobacter roggenkampii]